MMNRLKNTILMAMTVLLGAMATGCLKNDIPYPMIQCAFTSMVAEHELGGAVIDANNQVVTLTLDEQADLHNVKITSYAITEGATISQEIKGGIDLSGEVYSVTLSLYQDYEWVIKARQSIERYFTLNGQVGSSIIDVPAKRVVAYMPKSANLQAVMISSVKLGPEAITTMSPDLTGQTVDFTSPVKVKVSYNNEVEEWTIYVERSDQDVELKSADAWTRVIWLNGNGEAGKVNGFQYRQVGSDAWITVPESKIEHNGGSFSACVNGLTPNTQYECRATSGDLTSASTTVTTEPELTIPNMDFENWWKDDKVWCPWTEGGEAFWGTGNKGAATLGNSNSVPSTDTWDGKSGYSAQLDTKFVGIGVIGKLAAGNLFTGVYVRTDGTNGILDFGRPFTGRPTKLKGHMKYNCATISHSSAGYEQCVGQPDTCLIYIVLADWDKPFEIRTNPNDRHLLDVDNDSHIIGYGKVEYCKTVDKWTDFTINIDYRATNRKPKYVLIVASASKYGDFFTGGNGSTLWVDDFSLEWDY